MKKTLLVFFVLGTLATVAAFAIYHPGKKTDTKQIPDLEKELVLLNWENYISPEVISDFEKQYSVKVRLVEYEDSDYMFSRIQSQPDQYDLLVAEDDFVKLMKKLKMLSPLDHGAIPNIQNLKEEAKKNFFDPGNNFCLPYFAGYTGILVNENRVKDYPETTDLLWSEKYKGRIAMLNNPVEILVSAAYHLGFDPKKISADQLSKSRELALGQKELVYEYSDPVDQEDLIRGEKVWTAQTYSLDAFAFISRNPELNLKFFAPREGVLLWTDNWCVSKDAPHKNAAHAFLNYLYSPEVSAKNSSYLKASMLNKNMPMLPGDKSFDVSSKRDFPESAETLLKSFYFGDIEGGDFQAAANRLWADLAIPESEGSEDSGK